MQRHITIGPEFFAKAKNDYANWYWAIVREFMQNSIDCGSQNIEIQLDEQVNQDEQPETIMTVKNDGQPMTEEILLGKLLSLGGSGKNFTAGSVGGFGKAKEILYFCHRSYSIRTGTLLVEGAGATFQLCKDMEKFDGTDSFIVLEGHVKSRLEDELRKFAKYAQWSGTLKLNGATLVCDLAKGSRRRDLGFGIVYTNKSTENKLVVRIGGIPMFVEYCGHNRCVVVELAGTSSDVLTSNRDGMVRPFNSQLQSFITELAVDKRSALRDKGQSGPQYRRYAGRKLKHEKVQEGVVSKRSGLLQELVQPHFVVAAHQGIPPQVIQEGSCEGVSIGEVPDIEPGANEALNQGVGMHSLDYGSAEPAPRKEVATLGDEFVIKNESGLQVPAYFMPDSDEFSTYSRKLIRVWGRLMLTLHRVFDLEAEFGLGFIFDDSTEAEYEDGDYGKLYFLNPATIVEQTSGSRSFKKRFKLTERNRLLSIAVHEFVHGMGFGYHGEEYANKLTDAMAVVMDNRGKFNWCFQ